MTEDRDFLYAHIALQKFNILPTVFLKMSQKEKAFIIASIMFQQEKEEEASKKK